MALRPIKVGQLNNYINRVLRTDPILGNVSVIGEISNLKFHGSGHVYFSLKDDSSKVSCFIASSNINSISCPLEEGLEIIASGYISVYERGGYYSLNIRSAEANGIGQLAVKFEALKKKLEGEGIFDPAHKKAIPFFPEKVAIVTSETGAAVRDIIRTIKNKNNYCDILVYPTTVQGPAAPGEIVSAIIDINENHKDVDVIITGRGGGSIEELWAFNEESVARCIYSSEIPVISAVGHETDFTIADFAADLRAATPTAAAEAAVPDTDELNTYLDNIRASLNNDLTNLCVRKRGSLDILDPMSFLSLIQNRINFEQINLENIYERMLADIRKCIDFRRGKLKAMNNLLQASDPELILSRGYSVIKNEEGKALSSIGDIHCGDILSIEMHDGRASAEILNAISKISEKDI